MVFPVTVKYWTLLKYPLSLWSHYASSVSWTLSYWAFLARVSIEHFRAWKYQHPMDFTQEWQKPRLYRYVSSKNHSLLKNGEAALNSSARFLMFSIYIPTLTSHGFHLLCQYGLTIPQQLVEFKTRKLSVVIRAKGNLIIRECLYFFGQSVYFIWLWHSAYVHFRFVCMSAAVVTHVK